MVSLESITMTPESTTGSLDEHDAVHQQKMAMFRGTTGPSVLSKRLNRKVTMETEGTSTTDTDGTDAGESSDGLSDAPAPLDRKVGIDIESAADYVANAPDTMDCFDFMPSVRVRPAFSEKDYSFPQAGPADDAPWRNQMNSSLGGAPVMQPMAQSVQPMAMAPWQPPQAMQPTMMQAMPQTMMPGMQQMAAPSVNAQGQMMVPVPMPVQMPSMPVKMPSYTMQNLGSQSVPVPPGFKLVRIPEKMSEKVAETVSDNTSDTTKSAISDPANTERKIFVGGLNPSTTGQTLREYFSKFGPVMDAKVIREGEKSKGFGFVQFKESIPAEVLEQSHIIDQRRCGVGRAFHREGAQ